MEQLPQTQSTCPSLFLVLIHYIHAPFEQLKDANDSTDKQHARSST